MFRIGGITPYASGFHSQASGPSWAGALRLQCIHKWVMRRNAGRLEVHWSFLHLWNQDDNGMASIRLGAVADKN